MDRYKVTGMSCAACSARVEKSVSAVEGVTSCSVNLLTGSMGVEGTASAAEIIAAVEAAGYGASTGRKDGTGNEAAAGIDADMATIGADALEDKETPAIKRRLLTSLGFWLVLMYFSMGHMLWNWPLPEFFDDNHVAMGIVQLLLTTVVMVINQKFFISGFRSLWHRAPNMDALVSLGASAAFAYSTISLLAMTDAQVRGDAAAVMAYMDEFYFESAATILTLITLGKMLEARSKGRTTDALKSLIRLAPKTATLIRDGKELVVPSSQVEKGDIFVVRPGESIPVDGTVIDGESAVDESALTGESIPVDKLQGSAVSAGTINRSGFLRCEASRVGEDTTLSQIIQMVSDAAATKAPVARLADKVSGVFVPAVITIALITAAVWLLAGKDPGFALARGISVLVISCPCALGLATPVAIMVGSGMGARNGILFKTAVSLEETGKTQIVALDKTGTITRGRPEVTRIIPADGVSEEELLTLAYSLEVRSEHPLAHAITKKAESEGLMPKEVNEFRAMAGNGLGARLDGDELLGGSYAYISSRINLSEENASVCRELAEKGNTPVIFARGGRLLGIIAVADEIREDSPAAIRELKGMGLNVVMLTGDNESTARAIGERAGVDDVIAGVLPDGKESMIKTLKEKGRVLMIGDGINDAPALTRADIGMAIGAGTDVAIDAADVVLMKSSLMDAAAAIRLSRATLRNVHQNLCWAFVYNIMGIPLAAGVFIGVLGWQLNPMFAAAAMSLSSFCVVSNALRLNLFKIYDSGRDRAIKNKVKTSVIEEEKKMTKTIVIEGMMCGHCEMHARKALEAIDGVAGAEVSHETGLAVVTLDRDVADEVLTQAVEAEGYKVVEIK